MKMFNHRNCYALLASLAALLTAAASVQTAAQTTAEAPQAAQAAPAQTAPTAPADPTLALIREEGLQRSQVMKTLSFLTDVIGPRLTGSPNAKRANEWTRDQFTAYGMNARLESWNFNGRGWAVKRVQAQVVTPQQISLIAYPRAWSPGLEKPVVADVVWIDPRTEADLQNFQGKLKGAIVLLGPPRNVNPAFNPPAVRLTDADLTRIANARAGGSAGTRTTGATTAPGGRATTGAATSGPGGGGGRGRGPQGLPRGRVLSFLMQEGALMELAPSPDFDSGNISGFAATLPTGAPATGTAPATARGPRGGGGGRGGPNAYAPTAPATIPQVILAVEHYNRLVRMAQQNVPMKIDVDLQVQFFGDDLNAYNTIAEFPGTDLKDEVVMLGAHLDSFHMGTGATDNGTGVAVCMEAVRILTALKLQPRRTIRVGLWTGEEQGLLGSRAYVREHFGSNAGRDLLSSSQPSTEPSTEPASQPATQPTSQPVRNAEFQNFCIYFNTDDGAGRCRGLMIGNNPPARDLFRTWIQPLADLGCSTLSLARAGSTDLVSFDGSGLTAVNFIQDPLEYWSKTWHTSQDLYDRVPAEDMRVSSVVMATLVYQAATAEQKVPRRPSN